MVQWKRSRRQFFGGKNIKNHLRPFITGRRRNDAGPGREARDLDHSISRTVARGIDEDADLGTVRVFYCNPDAVSTNDELAVVVGRRAVDLEPQLGCRLEP